MTERYCKITKPKVRGEDIVQPKIPQFPQEQNVGNYLQSKLQETKPCVYPNWDVIYPEPGLDLMRIRRELYNKENKLSKKRIEYLKVRVDLDTEWKDLQEKEETLRKSFMQFHEFVKENEEKRERGKRRIAEEEIVHKRKDDEIEVMDQKVQKMLNVRASLEENVKKLKIFEDYLGEVCQYSGEYKAIANVLIRYDSLTSARNDLTKKQKENLEYLEKQRIQMMKLIEERVAVLMGLNNKLVDMEGRYDETISLARYWETVFYKTKNKCKRELLKIETVKNSARNVYEQMCKKKGVPVEIDKDNVEEILHYIKITIKEYKKITKIALKKVSMNNNTLFPELNRKSFL